MRSSKWQALTYIATSAVAFSVPIVLLSFMVPDPSELQVRTMDQQTLESLILSDKGRHSDFVKDLQIHPRSVNGSVWVTGVRVSVRKTTSNAAVGNQNSSEFLIDAAFKCETFAPYCPFYVWNQERQGFRRVSDRERVRHSYESVSRAFEEWGRNAPNSFPATSFQWYEERWLGWLLLVMDALVFSLFFHRYLFLNASKLLSFVRTVFVIKNSRSGADFEGEPTFGREVSALPDSPQPIIPVETELAKYHECNTEGRLPQDPSNFTCNSSSDVKNVAKIVQEPKSKQDFEGEFYPVAKKKI